MKVLYIGTPFLMDCDFPLVRSYQEKGIDVTYLILLPCFSLRSTLVDIKEQIPKTGIFKATEYAEFRQHEAYMDMSKVYVSNRISQSSYSLSYMKETMQLFKFIIRGHFDIVHYDWFFTGLRKIYYKLSNHWITTFHDPFPHTGEDKFDYQKRYKDTIEGSDGFVILNEKQKSDFCSFYNVDPSKVLVNRLGVYDNIRTFVDDSVKIKENNILFFGRISPYKGVEYLCEAMKIVHNEIPDATLTIAGGGKIYFDIEPYKQLDYIEVRNHYVDMKELAGLLSQCEFTVCPYTDATQSGVIMTSFSLHKPVVATNVGGLSETIEDDKSGLLVNPKNVHSLADGIISLLKDKTKLNAMSDYIRNHYSIGDGSWGGIADKYIAYYEGLL